MKISFIIPAYNEERYIVRCLESIIAETSKLPSNQYEILVVNNASTDGTANIAKSFANVKVIDESRKGLLYARQAGFENSSGELLANIDADTVLPSGWVHKVMQEFTNDSKLVALSGPFVYYDLSLLKNVGIRIYYYLGYLTHLFNHFVRIGALLQGGNFVLKRSALEKINGYNLNITFYGEDTDIAKRIRKFGKVKFNFRLPAYSSGRRIRTEGYVTMALKYPANYLSTTFFKKPVHNDYTDIRQSEIPANRTNMKKMTYALAVLQISIALAAGFGLSSLATEEFGAKTVHASNFSTQKAKAYLLQQKHLFQDVDSD